MKVGGQRTRRLYNNSKVIKNRKRRRYKRDEARWPVGSDDKTKQRWDGIINWCVRGTKRTSLQQQPATFIQHATKNVNKHNNKARATETKVPRAYTGGGITHKVYFVVQSRVEEYVHEIMPRMFRCPHKHPLHRRRYTSTRGVGTRTPPSSTSLERWSVRKKAGQILQP